MEAYKLKRWHPKSRERGGRGGGGGEGQGI